MQKSQRFIALGLDGNFLGDDLDVLQIGILSGYELAKNIRQAIETVHFSAPISEGTVQDHQALFDQALGGLKPFAQANLVLAEGGNA